MTRERRRFGKLGRAQARRARACAARVCRLGRQWACHLVVPDCVGFGPTPAIAIESALGQVGDA